MSLYHIRDIRHYISLSIAKTITSRLDYWNSLLYNITSKDSLKLQYVHNCLARVVTRSHRFPILSHFWNLFLGSLFNLASFSNVVLSPIKLCSSREPSFLFTILSAAPKPRQLGSSRFHLLSVPRVKTHTGTCAFSVAVPIL